MKQRKFNNVKQIIPTLVAAIIGGVLFTLIHIPVPWLLGPMIAVLIGTNAMKLDYVWPASFRNAGMILVGYTIGLSMTSNALQEMAFQLPSMLLMTLLLLLLCSGIAYVVSKLSGNDYSTSLLGSIPGGLTQVIMLAEETKGINLAVVTVTQVIRLMIIIIVMPLLVTIPLFGEGDANGSVNVVNSTSTSPEFANLFPEIIIFALVCILFALVGTKIKFPTAYLLGPIIGTTILQLGGLEGPHLPFIIIDMAQLMIGTHVGLMLRTDQISRKIRTFSLAIASGVLLVIGAIVLSLILNQFHPISNATALLSMAPGGMDQMGIIAHEIHADLSIVSGYQLFRTFFIYFAVPPLLKLIFTMMNKRKAAMQKRQHSNLLKY
ncbi:AbrB family transcriptional regulator [Virgibacillus oceani]|uniref:Aminopeptidase n=1 Tax=Virgibacillus oceani TaxID=1479511 RepID=A0A917M358_9BACI|nr:AbrB family transcriptional regulator [Virgibacillus oceani]GGG74363.1 aminopeptidase [Virgibacillus oceani]